MFQGRFSSLTRGSWTRHLQQVFGCKFRNERESTFTEKRVIPQITLLEDRTVPAGILGSFSVVNQLGSMVYQANGTGLLGQVSASDGFESGSLGVSWSTASSTSNGRIEVSGLFGTASGNYALLMDTTIDGIYNLNEAVLSVNLSGQSNAVLRFAHAVFNDEPETFAGAFSGSYNADGVAVSNDGVNWYPIFDAPSGFSGWQNVSIDLASAISGSGLTLNDSTFLIKFQQFDNFQLPTDGRGWDNISILTPGTVDSIPLTLDPGQTVSIAVDGADGLQVSARLLSGSTVVASATAAVSGGQAILPLVKVPGRIADGTPGTQSYTLEISGVPSNLGSYTIRTVLNAALENESLGGSGNDTTSTSQSLESGFVQLHRSNSSSTNGPLPARAAVMGTVDFISANVAEQEVNNPAPSTPPDLSLYAQDIDVGEWITGIDPYYLTETGQLTVNGTGDGTFDYYAFTIPTDFAPGSITITSDFLTVTGGEQLAAFFVFDSFGNWWIYGDEFSPSGLDFMPAGTYYLGVGTWNTLVGNGQLEGTAPPVGGNYSILFSVTDHSTTAGGSGLLAELEPNEPPLPPRPNLLDYAQNLDGEDWVLNGDPVVTDSSTIPHVSVIGTGDDTFDYYSFTIANSGDRAIFDIDFENFDSMLYLYDAAGNVLWASDDNGGDPGSNSGLASYIDYTFADSGQYVIAVGSYYSYDSNGQLTGSPVFTGANYTLHVSVENKAFVSPGPDLFSFNLSAGDTAAITISNLSSSGNIQVELLNGAGSVVATGTSTATNVSSAVASYSTIATGTYYVRVSGIPNTEYNLLVTRNATVELENNNSIATAQPVTSPQVAGRRWVTGAVKHNITTIQAIDTGWYDSFGFHGPTNTNYFVGQLDATRQLRDFFAFNTSSLQGTILSAQLQAFNPGGVNAGYLSPDPTETLELFDVSTPISNLVAGGSGLTAIYDDLGTGTSFGTRVVSAADNGTLISMNLNAAGLAALGAAGGQFAIGGTLTTIADNTELVRLFGFTSAALTRQLVVTTDDTDYYSISADGNAMLDIEVVAPASGAGDFANSLQPVVRLFDAAGNLVATGNTGSIKYKVPKNSGGSYSIEVSGGSGSQGEYILSIKGDRTNSARDALSSDTALQKSEMLVTASPVQPLSRSSAVWGGWNTSAKMNEETLTMQHGRLPRIPVASSQVAAFTSAKEITSKTRSFADVSKLQQAQLMQALQYSGFTASVTSWDVVQHSAEMVMSSEIVRTEVRHELVRSPEEQNFTPDLIQALVETNLIENDYSSIDQAFMDRTPLVGIGLSELSITR